MAVEGNAEIRNTPQFGRTGRSAEAAGADAGGGAPMSNRSLQEAFTRMMGAEEDGSDAAAGMPKAAQPSPQPRQLRSGRPAPSPTKASAKQPARTAKEPGSAGRFRSSPIDSSFPEGKDRRRSAAPSSASSPGASAASVDLRRRSAKRSESTATKKAEDDNTLSRLKQEVLAKDEEIVKLRAMCQEQASRLKHMEVQNSSEVETLKLRMEEFEQLLKGHASNMNSSQAAPAWPSQPFSSGTEEQPAPQPHEGVQDAPKASMPTGDIQGGPQGGVEGVSTQGAEDATAHQIEAPSRAPDAGAEDVLTARSSRTMVWSKPRARSSDAPEVRPHWAMLSLERSGELRSQVSPRQSSEVPWGPMLSPRNSLRSGDGGRSALEQNPWPGASAPLSCRSSQSSVRSSCVAVRKVQSQATLSGCSVAAPSNRTRSPSSRNLMVPMLGHAMSTRALSTSGLQAVPAVALSQPCEVYRQMPRNSRATLPSRPIPSWKDGSQMAPPSLPCRNVAYIQAGALRP